MSRIVGIDLGTTNSLIAHVEGGIPRVIPDAEGRALLPSVVAWTPNGVVVGEAARRQLARNAARTVYSVKRLMGRGYEDVKDELDRLPFAVVPSAEVITIRIGDREVTPPEVSAHVLRALKQRAEVFFGEPVEQAVITVPAYFNDAQRQATKDAGRIAGLEVLRIVNEPTAASLAYGLQKLAEGVIAVYDLGGGTFDISILRVKDGVFEVLATNGNTHLGGDDFDRMLVDWLLADIRSRHGVDLSTDPEALQELRLGAEAAKCRLSFDERTVLTIPFEGFTYHRAITRGELEALVEPLVASTLGPCRQALADAGLRREQVDQVVLVGGSTRMPLVRRRVEELFGRTPHSRLNPDEVVALGAAVHASELAARGGEALLIDVASHSLGVAVYGGGVRRLVAKNTPIPVVAREVFLPASPGQARARIEVFQGDGETRGDNAKLGEVLLSDLRVRHRSDVPLEVTFELSSEGTLSVRAMDLSSGLSQAVKLEQRTELPPAEVQKLRAEQKAYHRSRSAPEVQALRSFAELLARGEQLTRALGEAAEPERADAEALVESVRRLVALGRSAFRSGNQQQMAEITRRLTTLMSDAPA